MANATWIFKTEVSWKLTAFVWRTAFIFWFFIFFGNDLIWRFFWYVTCNSIMSSQVLRMILINSWHSQKDGIFDIAHGAGCLSLWYFTYFERMDLSARIFLDGFWTVETFMAFGVEYIYAFLYTSPTSFVWKIRFVIVWAFSGPVLHFILFFTCWVHFHV